MKHSVNRSASAAARPPFQAGIHEQLIISSTSYDTFTGPNTERATRTLNSAPKGRSVDSCAILAV